MIDLHEHLSVEDVYDILEVLSVDAHNRLLIADYQEKHRE
jgi:hypothetical protein